MAAIRLPTLLPGRNGYALGDEIVEGFADRPELDAAQRARIARWAERFGEGPSAAQVTASVLPTLDHEAESLTTGLIADRQELQELHLSGLLDELDEQQRGWLAHPQTHPDLGGVRYPLSVGALATLADSSEDQVRRWADSALLPFFRVGVERRFGRSGAARAMLLAGASKPEKAVLSAISQGQGRRVMLLIGAVVEDALARGDGLGSGERGRLAAALRVAADRLAPSSPRRPVGKARTADKGRTLKVMARDGSWVVVAPNARHVAIFATQSDAVKAARAKLSQSGGGELHVMGRRAVRKYPVVSKPSSGRPPQTRAKDVPSRG